MNTYIFHISSIKKKSGYNNLMMKFMSILYPYGVTTIIPSKHMYF